MLKDRAVQVSLVRKSSPGVATEGAEPLVDTEKIVAQLDDVFTKQLQNVALTVGTLLLAKKAADTLSELILITGRKYI